MAEQTMNYGVRTVDCKARGGDAWQSWYTIFALSSRHRKVLIDICIINLRGTVGTVGPHTLLVVLESIDRDEEENKCKVTRSTLPGRLFTVIAAKNDLTAPYRRRTPYTAGFL